MKQGIGGLLTCLTLLTLAGCTTPVGGTWPVQEGVADIGAAAAPATVVSGEGLVLTLDPLKPDVELGEPVYVAVTVVNTGADPQTVLGGLTPGEGLVDYVVTGPDGRAVEFGPLGESDFGEEERVTLRPGERIGDVAQVFYGAAGLSFPAPGNYTLRARLLVPNGQGRFAAYLSEPVPLSVADAEAGRRLLALPSETRSQAGLFLAWRMGDQLVAGKSALMEIADAHPTSALAAYAGAALARSLSEPFMDYRIGEVRPPDCAAAEAARGKVDVSVLPRNLRIDAEISRAHCQAASGNLRAALRALDRALAAADGQPHFAPLTERAARMRDNIQSAIK